LSAMVSYNLINGVQASESSYLLDTMLRQRFGFPFYVVSDWGAVTVGRALQAITAGTDVCMGSDVYKDELPLLISRKTASKEVLKRAVKNVLRTKICAGMTDFYPSGDKTFVNSAEHQQIALDGARKSVILLKNEGAILPLKKTVGKVALIGPNADKGNLNCYGSSETTPVYSISLKKGLENKIGESNLLYEMGCDMNSASTGGFKNAKLLASQASVVIFAGGLDYTQEGEGYNNYGDRKNRSSILPGMQLDLIDTLTSVNQNVIVVIQSGGVCSMNRVIDKTKGLVYSFYAGQEAGNAIADVLFGDYNPSGRMPVTMPATDSQLPGWNDDFTDDFGCGYRWFDEKKIVPEFAFGFGLSYTKYEYSNQQLSAKSLPAGASVQVSVDVQNVGTESGEEVVQLYMSNRGSSLWMPQKELKGFDRISLGTCQKQTVVFELTSEDFYYWDETAKSYKVNPGAYILQVGGSSDSLLLRDTLELTSSEGRPDLKITEVFSVPRYPKKNDPVYFYALVKNQGNVPVTTGDKFSISFLCNDTGIASANDVSEAIGPGQVRLIGSGAPWNASTDAFVLKTVVDNKNVISEWIETNNIFAKQISLPGVDIGFEPVKNSMKKQCANSVSYKLSGKHVIVNSDKAIVNRIAVSDLSGRCVSVSRGRFMGSTKISTANLSSGVYFVECAGKGLRSVGKIIIR